MAGAGLLGFVAAKVAARRGALAANLGLAAGVSLIGLLAADAGYGIYRNLQARDAGFVSFEAREADPVTWHGEIFPERYHPTERAFFLYKPGTDVTADVYGEFYHTELRAVPLVADSVLERKRLTYRIGPHGLRDLDALAEPRTFVIGDSFAMGYGTTEGETWIDLVERETGEPLYNMGVSSTGPRQQLQLLEHLLATRRDSVRVEHVVWMIFEGNDLENSYATGRPPPPAPPGLAEGTLLAPVLEMPSAIRDGSVLRRLAQVIGNRAGGAFEAGGLAVEGLRSPYPLYHSEALGYRLFNPLDVERATMDAAYLENHPNRARLEETLADMAGLAAREGFAVTVVVAPSAARLHGPAFSDFPTLAPPHLVDFVLAAASAEGFGTVNLLEALAPAAASELLYYRDDHHWNRRGNELVAEVVADKLRQTRSIEPD